MSKMHVKLDGNMGKCTAQPGNCPRGESLHADNKQSLAEVIDGRNEALQSKNENTPIEIEKSDSAHNIKGKLSVLIEDYHKLKNTQKESTENISTDVYLRAVRDRELSKKSIYQKFYNMKNDFFIYIRENEPSLRKYFSRADDIRLDENELTINKTYRMDDDGHKEVARAFSTFLEKKKRLINNIKAEQDNLIAYNNIIKYYNKDESIRNKEKEDFQNQLKDFGNKITLFFDEYSKRLLQERTQGNFVETKEINGKMYQDKNGQIDNLYLQRSVKIVDNIYGKDYIKITQVDGVDINGIDSFGREHYEKNIAYISWKDREKMSGTTFILEPRTKGTLYTKEIESEVFYTN